MVWLLEDEIKGYYKSGKLPHYDNDEVYQFITIRSHDSVPKLQIDKWIDKFSLHGDIDKNSKEYILFQRKILEYEDRGYGECYLKNPKIFKLVQDALEYFDGTRYDLVEWIIMPNHVHVLIKPYSGYSLPKIVHSWKSFTAKKANEILNRKGKFWMEEYFDRYIRSELHFDFTVNYIRENGKAKQVENNG